MQLEKKRTLLLLAPSHRQRRPSRGVGVFIRPLLPSPASRSRKDYKQRDTPPQDLLHGTSQPSSVGRSFRPAVRKYLLRSAKRQILNQVFGCCCILRWPRALAIVFLLFFHSVAGELWRVGSVFWSWSEEARF